MKVICINDSWGVTAVTTSGRVIITPTQMPEFGKPYNVVRCVEWFDQLYYGLEEFRNDQYFSHTHFNPASEIDETELVKERELCHTSS